MELQVTVTLSDRLFELLEDKLPNLGRRVERAITKELGAQVRAGSAVKISAKQKAAEPTAEVITAVEPAAVEPTIEDPVVEETANDPVPSQEPEANKTEKELTEADIRAVIHRTRQRFIGDDYKENTTSEKYKKYFKALTSQFKQISAVLGSEVPSKLPADKRAAFIEVCEALELDENGLITAPPAPF